jgi:hypothetical protein
VHILFRPKMCETAFRSCEPVSQLEIYIQHGRRSRAVGTASRGVVGALSIAVTAGKDVSGGEDDEGTSATASGGVDALCPLCKDSVIVPG